MAEYQVNANNEPPKKKSQRSKYLIYLFVVLIATAISLTISLWGDNFTQAKNAMMAADYRFVLITFGVVILTYLIQGLSLLIFCRLYTRKYKYHQSLACIMVGQFYSDVTPGASGGQVMQVYTMKSQGMQVSNSASIMVMWFIINQSVLILFGALSLILQWNNVMSISPTINLFGWEWNPPMWPLILFGFGINLSVILLLFVMSYSHKFHNFILNHVINFLGKIHILKHPDKTREDLRVQVENFKIELRRLQSNIPVLILLFILFSINIFLTNSIPYFCGLAMHAWGDDISFKFVSLNADEANMVNAAFLTSFHQMITGLIPLPGSAGVSEIFYNAIFGPKFFKGVDSGVVSATQILWRTATFHVPLLISGVVSAFYRSRGGAAPEYASRKTYVTLQMETLDERKQSANTMYETSQFSRKEFQKRLGLTPKKNETEKSKENKHAATSDGVPEEIDDSFNFSAPIQPSRVEEPLPYEPEEPSIKELKPKRTKKKKKKTKKADEDTGWTNWEI